MKGESRQTWFFRQGMNLYPMYFGTGGRVRYLQGDWKRATIELTLGLWTRNYAGTIFGGSMFAAIDPFHMVLLLNILGIKNYVVWGKAGVIQFKKPGRGRLRADVIYTDEELATIRSETAANGRYEFVKSVDWVDQQGAVVSTVQKTIYVATKEHYRAKQAARSAGV